MVLKTAAALLALAFLAWAYTLEDPDWVEAHYVCAPYDAPALAEAAERCTIPGGERGRYCMASAKAKICKRRD